MTSYEKLNYTQSNWKLQHGGKNQYDSKIDLLKLIFRLHLPETIRLFLDIRLCLESETKIFVLINQFYNH